MWKFWTGTTSIILLMVNVFLLVLNWNNGNFWLGILFSIVLFIALVMLFAAMYDPNFDSYGYNSPAHDYDMPLPKTKKKRKK